MPMPSPPFCGNMVEAVETRATAPARGSQIGTCCIISDSPVLKESPRPLPSHSALAPLRIQSPIHNESGSDSQQKPRFSKKLGFSSIPSELCTTFIYLGPIIWLGTTTLSNSSSVSKFSSTVTCRKVFPVGEQFWRPTLHCRSQCTD